MSQASVLLSSTSSENELLTSFYYGTYTLKTVGEKILIYCIRFVFQKIYFLVMFSYVINKFLLPCTYSMMGNFRARKSRLQNSHSILSLRYL